MMIHNLIQGSPEWKAYRARHLNASDAAAMLGCSPYKTRAELLREMHTGLAAEVDVGTQMQFNNGHRVEALARPLAEEFIGEDLYPITGSQGRLSASFDGLTLDESTGFEHKALNGALRAVFAAIATIGPADDAAPGRLLPIHHRVQMEQQLLVSGAERILFMTSAWTGDGELIEERRCWYYQDAELRCAITDGWHQFDIDLAAYTLPESPAPAPVGKAPETLPALHIEVTGAVTASNLVEFKATALAAIRSVNRNLQTDRDFADADKAIKWCADVEARLKAAKEHALGQTASIDALFKALDDIAAESKAVRLDLGKVVDRRKVERKEEAIAAARHALGAHYGALNAELAPASLPVPPVDFAGAIRGLRSIDSMQDALDTVLAKSKIEADIAARRIRVNQATFKAQATGFEFLFRDLGQLVHKEVEDFTSAIHARITEHQKERLDSELKARIDARIRQLRDALTACAGMTATQIEAKRMAVMGTEPSEDLYGERMGEAVKLRSQVLVALGEQHQVAVQREKAALDTSVAVVAAAAQAPAATPVFAPAQRAPATEPPSLRLGQINERLGYIVNADLLGRMGFAAHSDRAAKLYREGDFAAICAALSAHTLAVGCSTEEASK